LTVKVVSFKERAAKVQLFSMPRKGLEQSFSLCRLLNACLSCVGF
jgi:hypothetical protein